MSVTSEYIFPLGFFNSQTENINIVKAQDQPFSESVVGGLLMTVNRPNAEHLVPLGSAIRAQATGLIDDMLAKAGGVRRSPIRVQGVPWLGVPYFIGRPLSHNLSDMLVRVDFDYHVPTPWGCWDVDGVISVYLFIFLNQGHLQGHFDGAWFSAHAGGPDICFSTVVATLKSKLTSKSLADQVNKIIAQAFAASSDIKFSKIYFLPGNGDNSAGTHILDASADLAMGLLT
jgi:hypothetical protein